MQETHLLVFGMSQSGLRSDTSTPRRHTIAIAVTSEKAVSLASAMEQSQGDRTSLVPTPTS